MILHTTFGWIRLATSGNWQTTRDEIAITEPMGGRQSMVR